VCTPRVFLHERSARKFIKKKPKVSARQQRKREERRKEADEGGRETDIAGGRASDSDHDENDENDENDDNAHRVGKKWKKTKYMRRHRYGLGFMFRVQGLGFRV
jgi:hypothetical protein